MNPILTKILGSLSGNLIESVGKIIDNTTLSKEEKASITEQTVEEVNRHLEAIDTIELEMFKTTVNDTKSARQREVSVANTNTGWLSKNIGSLLAIIATVIFSTIIILVLTKSVKANETVTSSIITGMFAIEMVILQYYYGSSRGSSKQQESMDKMVSNLTK